MLPYQINTEKINSGGQKPAQKKKPDNRQSATSNQTAQPASGSSDMCFHTDSELSRPDQVHSVCQSLHIVVLGLVIITAFGLNLVSTNVYFLFCDNQA